MECTRCKQILNKNNFTYKNIEKKIYYQHCNNCRNKYKENTPQPSYEHVCEICLKKYIVKSISEIRRHKNSIVCKKHLENMSINKNLNKYYKYNIYQLRKICIVNGIKYASKMSKDDIIKELIKIENVIIPDLVT